MAKMSFAKSCKGSFEAAACKVTGACPAAALCEGGKTLPLSDRSEGALTILRSFEIASEEVISKVIQKMAKMSFAKSCKG